MSTKYSKINCQYAVTARATGHASANNAVEEFAQATEELVAELTEKHSKQIEALIKANNKAMAKLTAALLQSKAPSAAPAAPISHSKSIRSGLQDIETLEREVSNCNNLSALQQDPSQSYPRPVLGIGGQCPQVACRMEIGKEHLTGHGAVSNNRVAFNG
jgi:hypothetical protein